MDKNRNLDVMDDAEAEFLLFTPLFMNYHITQAQIAEEERWIIAAKENPRQFAKLYDFYYKRIFLFIFKRVEDEDTAVDVTQQTFLKAMQSLGKYTPQGVPFSAWLYRIASNEVNLHYRTKKTQATESADMNQLAEILQESSAEKSDENIQIMLKELQTLPEEDVRLISLRFFEEMSFKEVADILEITENNAKVRCYRILDRLKKKLEKKIIMDSE